MYKIFYFSIHVTPHYVMVIREMDSWMIYMAGMICPSKYSFANVPVSKLGGILCT